ncbi:MAG: hypothetical protein M1819_006080 [Sarea resinae]|nr:MAG: hypothetical protein M1819_006080 [Sarea resinae]
MWVRLFEVGPATSTLLPRMDRRDADETDGCRCGLQPEYLLSSPTFHRAVQNVHKKVHELRHGKAPEDMGGLTRDNESGPSDAKKFLQYYIEELKEQARGGPKK